MQETTSLDDERRAHKRYLYIGRAFIGLPQGCKYAGTIVDLSIAGCLVRLTERAALAAHAEIEINLQSNYLAFRTMGCVRRYAESGTILGIEFQIVSTRGQSDLRALIADLESEPLQTSLQLVSSKTR